MIYGIGTDIVDINRIQKDYEKHGSRLANRILTESELIELEHTQNKAAFIAKRFAAKEAFSKAFGTGLKEGVYLRSITISHDSEGKPIIETNEVITEKLKSLNLTSHLSIADEHAHAIAFVILEKR